MEATDAPGTAVFARPVPRSAVYAFVMRIHGVATEEGGIRLMNEAPVNAGAEKGVQKRSADPEASESRRCGWKKGTLKRYLDEQTTQSAEPDASGSPTPYNKAEQNPNETLQTVVATGSVLISGISADFSVAVLTDIFSRYGKVLGAKVITSKTRTFGVVVMSSAEEALKCVERINNTVQRGCMLFRHVGYITITGPGCVPATHKRGPTHPEYRTNQCERLLRSHCHNRDDPQNNSRGFESIPMRLTHVAVSNTNPTAS